MLSKTYLGQTICQIYFSPFHLLSTLLPHLRKNKLAKTHPSPNKTYLGYLSVWKSHHPAFQISKYLLLNQKGEKAMIYNSILSLRTKPNDG